MGCVWGTLGDQDRWPPRTAGEGRTPRGGDLQGWAGAEALADGTGRLVIVVSTQLEGYEDTFLCVGCRVCCVCCVLCVLRVLRVLCVLHVLCVLCVSCAYVCFVCMSKCLSTSPWILEGYSKNVARCCKLVHR